MEWYDKNSAAIIAASAALIASFIAGIFALGGAWLNHRFSNKLYKEQKVHDLAKDNKRLYLDKGEELHSLLTKWGNLAYASFQYDLSFIRGELGDNYSNDVLKDQFDVNTYTRLSPLVNIYFPHLLPDFDNARISALSTSEIVIKYVREEVDRIKALEDFNYKTMIYQTSLEKTLKTLQDDLLKKLETEPL